MATEPSRRSWIRRLVGLFVAHSIVTVLVAVVAFILGWGTLARSLPELQGWHLDAPEREFTAADATPGYTLDDYLAQEALVFDELAALIRDDWADDDTGYLCRYSPASICNPETILDRNWNRTFILEPGTAPPPAAGALLVHGLSDSPYSLRALGQRLHAEGWIVLGLRVPGHGTSPKALDDVSHRDWAAAVRVAAKGLRARLPDGAPMVLVGLSNGGALAVKYAVEAVDDPALPRPEALVLFSPMIGITPAARLTQLSNVVRLVPGFEKAAWSRIEAEIDPFKYSSWPNNASEQAFALTQRVEAGLARLERTGRLDGLPPVLAFQSAVDSTVRAPLLISRLFDRLGPDSELVVFDVNRVSVIDELLRTGFEHELAPLLDREDLPFALTLIANESPDSLRLVARRRAADEYRERPLELEWPQGVFSLSHGSPPIPHDDPIYGTREATDAATGLPLGSIRLRGEQGVLRISEGLMIRLRHNPFYDDTEARTLAWLDAVVSRHVGP